MGDAIRQRLVISPPYKDNDKILQAVFSKADVLLDKNKNGMIDQSLTFTETQTLFGMESTTTLVALPGGGSVVSNPRYRGYTAAATALGWGETRAGLEAAMLALTRTKDTDKTIDQKELALDLAGAIFAGGDPRALAMLSDLRDAAGLGLTYQAVAGDIHFDEDSGRDEYTVGDIAFHYGDQGDGRGNSVWQMGFRPSGDRSTFRFDERGKDGLLLGVNPGPYGSPSFVMLGRGKTELAAWTPFASAFVKDLATDPLAAAGDMESRAGLISLLSAGLPGRGAKYSAQAFYTVAGSQENNGEQTLTIGDGAMYSHLVLNNNQDQTQKWNAEADIVAGKTVEKTRFSLSPDALPTPSTENFLTASLVGQFINKRGVVSTKGEASTQDKETVAEVLNLTGDGTYAMFTARPGEDGQVTLMTAGLKEAFGKRAGEALGKQRMQEAQAEGASAAQAKQAYDSGYQEGYDKAVADVLAANIDNEDGRVTLQEEIQVQDFNVQTQIGALIYGDQWGYGFDMAPGEKPPQGDPAPHQGRRSGDHVYPRRGRGDVHRGVSGICPKALAAAQRQTHDRGHAAPAAGRGDRRGQGRYVRATQKPGRPRRRLLLDRGAGTPMACHRGRRLSDRRPGL